MIGEAASLPAQLEAFSGIPMDFWHNLRESLNGDNFLETMNVLDLRMGRWCPNPWGLEQVYKPGARRNPAGATLGRHFIISGGYSEEEFATLSDTWAFDMKKGTLPLKCGGPCDL